MDWDRWGEVWDGKYFTNYKIIETACFGEFRAIVLSPPSPEKNVEFCLQSRDLVKMNSSVGLLCSLVLVEI